jgi:hypothetical protein
VTFARAGRSGLMVFRAAAIAVIAAALLAATAAGASADTLVTAAPGART